MKTWISGLALLTVFGCMSPSWALEDTLPAAVLHNAATANADGTTLDVSRYSAVGLDITISGTATVTINSRPDPSSTFRAQQCTNLADSSGSSVYTASATLQCNTAGMAQLQAVISGCSGCTVTVRARVTTAKAPNGGAGAVTGWPSSSSSKEITWANSLANAARIGDGVTPICLYTDATLGPQVRPCTDANVLTIIPANFTWSLWDIEAAAAVETVDPDAATVQGMWSYGTAYRPKKSIYFPAGALNVDGTQCGQPTERTINSGALRYTIICTDNDASTIYGEAEMPDSWDGGTVTLMGVFVQTAADTNNLNADIAMACRVDGDTINNTWGTEVAMDTAMGGSNKIDTVTTAAITPNGTCTGAGTMLQWRYQLDAGGTTTAVATLHHLGFKLVYSTKSRSD